MFFMSGSMYFAGNEEVLNGFKQLGFPLFFVHILGTAKLLGAVALLQPWFPKLKEWAYAGFTFVLIGATWTHLATNTPFVMVIVIAAVLGVSYYLNDQVQKARSAVN